MEEPFEKRDARGDIGHNLVKKHLQKMLADNVELSRLYDVKQNNVEGADFEAAFMVMKKPYANVHARKRKGIKLKYSKRKEKRKQCYSRKEKNLYPKNGLCLENVYGGVEVKTFNLKSFLKDNTNPGVLSGTLRIPIWQKEKPHITWFQRITYPHMMWRKQKGDSKRSLVLIFVIEDWGKPLFTIVFTDISAFIRTIYEGLECIDIENLHHLPIEAIDSLLSKKQVTRKGNCMYVPLEWFGDMPIVTWVNSNTVESVSKSEPGELYRLRLDHLDRLAAERRFYESDPPDNIGPLPGFMEALEMIEMNRIKQKTKPESVRKGIHL